MSGQCPFKIAFAESEKIRPLNIVSDFVVEDMPEYIGHVLNGESATALIDKLGEVMAHIDIIAVAGNDLKTALLDIKMLGTVAQYLVREKSFPDAQRIKDAADREIEKIVPDPVYSLTYEDIILSNPASDFRCFLPKTMNRPEIGFYHGHQMIEQQFVQVTALLYQSLLTRDADLFVNNISQAKEVYKQQINPVMARYRTQLDVTEFNAFRPFFAGDLARGEKGPSGAFTAQLPLIDRLMFGKDNPLLEHFKVNRKYFPKDDVAFFEQIDDSIGSVKEAKQSFGNDTVLTEYKKLVEQIAVFRQTHLGAVNKHIPEGTGGTGGEETPHLFLKDRVRQTKQHRMGE